MSEKSVYHIEGKAKDGSHDWTLRGGWPVFFDRESAESLVRRINQERAYSVIVRLAEYRRVEEKP